MNNGKCPNCGSLAVQRTGMFGLGIILFLVTGCLMWIPIIGWIGAPITLIGSIGCIIMAPFNKNVGCKCKSCKYAWSEKKVSKSK